LDEPQERVASVSGSNLGSNQIAPMVTSSESTVPNNNRTTSLEHFPIKQLANEVVGSVMRTPTKYQKPKGCNYLPSMIGRVLLRPATDLIKDEKQVLYLLDEIKELQKGGFTVCVLFISFNLS